jgi:hypothetical protein
VSLLDNLNDYCDATASHRYNNCNGLRYGFHWTDLGVSVAAVTRVDVQFESGENCEGSSSAVRLNDQLVGNFVPLGDCECEAAHGTISFSNIDVGAYSRAGLNTISIAPNGVCEGLSRTANLGNYFARVTVTYRPNSHVCEVGVCNPGTGACGFATAPDGTACTDGNPCTTGDACNAGACAGVALDCNDDNPCTDDSCDPATGCVHTNNTDVCSDGSACTSGDRCADGACLSGEAINCGDNNACTDDSCDPATGCVFANNTNACNDGNACTRTDSCSSGSCVGSNPVVCGASDQCHDAGVCNPATGVCSNPVKPNGTSCNDASLCTTGETCQSGTCTPAFSGLSEPNPRSNGYYKRLCHGPHSGDQLIDADATCVGSVAAKFAGISTVSELCAMLEPSHPNNDPCDRTEDDLIVLALNVCRARVCTGQSIDSQCGGNATVGASLAESDAILNDASRSAATCAYAKCLDEEINTGRALELDSLTLRREGSGVRLSWNPPYLDDGSSHPSKYNVWRRTQGSLTAFTKIATTTDATFVDSLAAGGAYQYEVTAVMN